MTAQLGLFPTSARIAKTPILFWFGAELWAFHMLLDSNEAGGK